MAHVTDVTWYAGGVSAEIVVDGHTWYVAPSADDRGYVAWTSGHGDHRHPTILDALTAIVGADEAKRLLTEVAS